MNSIKIINPATDKVITEAPQANRDDIDRAIDAARRAFDQGPWPGMPLSQRKGFLLKIAQGILAQAEELAKLETENTGKPIKESTFMDIPSSAKTFEYFAQHLEDYLAGKKVKLESSAESYLCYEPRGVVLLIVPWNYPLLIASWKMAQALAAGNTVILKPSSLTPLTAFRLGEIIKGTGLPEGVVNIISASGQDLGSTLCSDPRIDMISFTGSTATGREVMRFAAENTKKLVMELGGKSASIVLADCDLETALSGTLASIFLNQGQMCTAMSRILVERDIFPQFSEQFADKVRKIKLGNGLNPETQMGPLISREHREKVLSCVEKAKAEGARLLCGGRIPGSGELNNGFFFEPAVFTQVTPKMSIFQEEIFGPVACLVEFAQEEQALMLANNSAFGLACCIWSNDLDKAKDLSRKIDAGIIWINNYGMFYNQVPYGGFKQSGFGKELGQEGFLEYSRLKHINYDLSNDPPLVSYWYAFG